MQKFDVHAHGALLGSSQSQFYIAPLLDIMYYKEGLQHEVTLILTITE